MTNTRLLFYATFATCLTWAGVAFAHPAMDGAPATAQSASAPVAASALKAPASRAKTNASHVAAKAAPVTREKRKAAPQASANGSYHLLHMPHPRDSYQNAVTPLPVTIER